MKDPPFHHFNVFSIINDDDTVQVKHAQCNNCGIIHKVFDLCRSEILHGKEAFAALPMLDEIKMSIPIDVRNVLDANNVDPAVYEQVKFLVLEKQWGHFVVLSTEQEGVTRTVKYLHLIGENLVRVETTTLEEGF